MQKKKKISKKSKIRLIWFGIPSLVVIICFCVTLGSYIYNYSSLKQEEKNLNDELYALHEEKKHLKTEIQMLNDPNYIIRYAKEKYLYSTEGEYVIKLSEEKLKTEEEEENSNTIYIALCTVAIVLCILFVGKKKTK